MRYLASIVLFLSMATAARAQSYADSIAQYRAEYIKDLLAEPRHPINASQAKYINFFQANRKYCVVADFKETPGSMPFLLPTHSGKQKPFREYGYLTFYLDGTLYTLHAYQSVDMLNDAAHKDDLFIPFNDLTNYAATYGGGRYIDLSIKDIHNGGVVLDFNKCYNPYCAYADGFSCPIPPSENHLEVDIKAGERVFPR